MANEIEHVRRIGINLTEDDLRVIRKVKLQLKPTHGELTTTALFRVVLRQMLTKA